MLFERGMRRGGLPLLVAIALIAAGCETVLVRDPLPAGWANNDAHARTEFWYELARRPVTTNDEAFHAILLYQGSYQGNADPAADYPSRVQALQSQGLLPRDFTGQRDQAVDRGTLAVALTKILRIRGGLTMRLTGPTPRYAVRALEFRDIYPPSSPNQILTGGEFVAVMQKAEEFQLGSPADSPAALLPDHIRRAGGALTENAPPSPDASPTSSATPARLAEPAFASALVLPESLSLAFIPPPRMVIYLDDRGEDEATGVIRDNDGLRRSHALFAADDVPGDATASPAVGSPAPNSPAPYSPAPGTPALGSPAPGNQAPSNGPAILPPRRMRVIVTGVQGDNDEVRRSSHAPWEKCTIGLLLHESAEFRTGPKSAIQFIIPPDQTFCLDSNGSVCVLDAIARGRKVSTDLGLEHGRVRFDLAHPVAGAEGTALGNVLGTSTTQTVQIEEAGLEHDALIRSPHAALALRGTEVSLFEQDGFDPEAISLTGRALFVNTNGQTVPFGGRSFTVIRGNQTSAVQQALLRSAPELSLYLSRTDFELREIALVIQRGGFVVGDVVVGDLHLSDFPKLPGALDFVLQWSGTAESQLNDLNLAVFSPLNTKKDPDFVSNPPFIYSLNPNSAATKKIIASNYPALSRSGGRLTENSIGPDGLEIAYFPKGFPAGFYKAVVFDLIDAANPPKTQTDPVTYSVDVYLDGQHIYTNTQTIGLLQTQTAINEPIPPPSEPAAALSRAISHANDVRIGHALPIQALRVELHSGSVAAAAVRVTANLSVRRPAR